MSPNEIVTHLASLGCGLRIDGEKLIVRDTGRKLTDGWRQVIREHKAGLMRALFEAPGYIKRCSRCYGTDWGPSGKTTEDGAEIWSCKDCTPDPFPSSGSLVFSDEALHALECFEDCCNVFLTGKAGTGKSTLLGHFRQTTEKRIAVLAPTGVAAVNVRGQTIHSFFGFGIDITPEKARRSARNSDLFRSLDAIVIDEISMARADLLDCVDAFLRVNGPDEYAAFGGIQMIFIGDPYQLAPVVRDEESELFRTHYRSPYFFDAKVLDKVPLETIYLNSGQQFNGSLI
jgi:PIF1-like helicase